jgi:hypothetical protein
MVVELELELELELEPDVELPRSIFSYQVFNAF